VESPSTQTGERLRDPLPFSRNIFPFISDSAQKQVHRGSPQIKQALRRCDRLVHPATCLSFYAVATLSSLKFSLRLCGCMGPLKVCSSGHWRISGDA
jgi:hypothetical protein